MINNPDEKAAIENAKKLLYDFKSKLEEIEKQKSRGINVFYATGMQTQEVKHSAFLAWLLNPSKEHLLGKLFLSKFLEELGVMDDSYIQSFLGANDITVETEKILSGIESRIDIFIQSESSKTLIIIENKVFTTTHDEQLKRYEQLVADRKDWRKIFVYLTPKGDKPTENGEEEWLLLSYEQIVQILDEILNTRKTGLKLKYLIKDYIDLVNLNILLKNNDIKKICRQIQREHAEALQILFAYSDNAEQVFSYCKEWLKQRIPDLAVVKEGKAVFNFYTENLKQYFLKNGEDIVLNGKQVKCRYGLGYSETVACGISIEKDGLGSWSDAQIKIKENFARDIDMSGSYLSFREYAVLIMSAKDRETEFEKIKSQLNERLSIFLKNLKAFENELLNIN